MGIWLGPVLAVAAVASYFTVIARWPVLSDMPVASFAVLALAVGLSYTGLRRAWSRGIVRRIAGVAGLAVSTLSLAFLMLYVFSMSADLPDASSAMPVGTKLAPLTLNDQNGDAFDVTAAAKRGLVLVFFRGHW